MDIIVPHKKITSHHKSFEMQEAIGLSNKKKPASTENIMAASFSDMVKLRFEEDEAMRSREVLTCADGRCVAGADIDKAKSLVKMCTWMFGKYQTMPAGIVVGFSSLDTDERVRVQALDDLLPKDKDVVYIDEHNNYHKFRRRADRIVVSYIRSDIAKEVNILFQ